MKATDMTRDDYIRFFSKRLAQLRAEKGISARQMSRDIGLNDSYINHIENGQTLTSMAIFFDICEYLEVSPSAFLDPARMYPRTDTKLLTVIENLSSQKKDSLIDFILSWDKS